jgi:1-acyl-sn-glycerol-3-phosphate acyltransferase
MKVKPPKSGRARRRTLSIAIYAGAWVLLTLGMPLWILLGVWVGLWRRRSFIVLRLIVFGWFYFGFELVALLLVGLLFLSQRNTAARERRLYALQAWWASVNLRVASAALGLTIHVEGAELAVPGPVILLVRHASILDTLIPCTYVQRPYRFRVRYVLKQELLFDPCLDIVGNALPNYFVDRSGNTQRELDGVRALAADLGSDGLLMFPEGTRFSSKKRERALDRLQSEGSPFAEAARAMSSVLPPKPGGVLTLLNALPDVDCVFIAHRGLESFAKISSLLSGEVVGARVDVKFWRVEGSAIPREDDERLRWLYDQWSQVDTFVRKLSLVGG